jgi:hypothetical protein
MMFDGLRSICAALPWPPATGIKMIEPLDGMYSVICQRVMQERYCKISTLVPSFMY